MARKGRKRSLRSSSSSSNDANTVERDVARAAVDSSKVSKKGLKCHYYSTDDDDDAEIHTLDGVEYKNYNDFVQAKRKRNEAYLKTLGFDSNSHKPKPTKASSEPKKDIRETEIEQARVVSPPASSYYNRFEKSEISLDAASLATDPFDQISKLIMELETEILKVLNLQKGTQDWSCTETASKAEYKANILSLLQGILSHLSPSSHEDPSLREKYIEAFQQLEGVEQLLWLSDAFCWYEYENFDIAGLCLEILRDACCVSVGTATSNSSASETVALDLVKRDNHETLQFLIELIQRSLEWLDWNSSKSKRRRNRTRSSANTTGTPEPEPPQNHTDSSEVRRRKTLEMTSKVWGLFFNLTYFGSTMAIVGEYEYSTMDRLIHMTHSSLAALDACVTQDLAKILPLPPALEQTTSTKRPRSKKTQAPKTQDIAQVTPEAIENCKSIAMEASRVLEPILGTIRNLIADPMTSSSDWETKTFVSLVLDIFCKGEEDAKKPQKIHTGESDWLHFVTQSFGNPVSKDAPPPTLFRWAEQSEVAVWELLGVFKACLGKGVLCTYTHDVERLVGFCLRCLRRFGTCSSRTTLRILGLAEGLTTPSWNGVCGLTSAKAGIQKQILIREGFLHELVHLSRMYSSLQARGSLPSNGDTVRSELESLIAKLRWNSR